MTSANVITFIIRKDGAEVGQHRVNVMCKEYWEKLLVYEPYDKHTIQATGYDEEEEYWEAKPVKLLRFLKEKAETNREIREKLATLGIHVESLQEWYRKNKDKIKRIQTRTNEDTDC